MYGHPLAKPKKSGFHTSPAGLALTADVNGFCMLWGCAGGFAAVILMTQ
jgi:hypothetical protein